MEAARPSRDACSSGLRPGFSKGQLGGPPPPPSSPHSPSRTAAPGSLCASHRTPHSAPPLEPRRGADSQGRPAEFRRSCHSEHRGRYRKAAAGKGWPRMRGRCPDNSGHPPGAQSPGEVQGGRGPRRPGTCAGPGAALLSARTLSWARGRLRSRGTGTVGTERLPPQRCGPPRARPARLLLHGPEASATSAHRPPASTQDQVLPGPSPRPRQGPAEEAGGPPKPTRRTPLRLAPRPAASPWPTAASLYHHRRPRPRPRPRPRRPQPARRTQPGFLWAVYFHSSSRSSRGTDSTHFVGF